MTILWNDQKAIKAFYLVRTGLRADFHMMTFIWVTFLRVMAAENHFGGDS